MTEIAGEGLNKNVGDKKDSVPEKSIFQEIWGRFKEGMKKLWGHADAKLEPVNEKAKEISEKVKIDSLKDYFKIQIENLKDGMRARMYDIYGVFYDIGAGVSRARRAISHFIFGDSALGAYLRGKPGSVEKLRKEAKDWHDKAIAKAKENREKRDKLYEKAKEVREKAANN